MGLCEQINEARGRIKRVSLSGRSAEDIVTGKRLTLRGSYKLIGKTEDGYTIVTTEDDSESYKVEL